MILFLEAGEKRAKAVKLMSHIMNRCVQIIVKVISALLIYNCIEAHGDRWNGFAKKFFFQKSVKQNLTPSPILMRFEKYVYSKIVSHLFCRTQFNSIMPIICLLHMMEKREVY